MNIVTMEDANYLAQQSSGRINMILSGMTTLMNDTDGKVATMESQGWFQRMVKTVTGKNKLTQSEIQQNHDKLNAYMSEAIAELYNRNCIDHEVMMSLGTQLNELYADHVQLKQMLGAFVGKLNEKIDSVDNFHMLTTEINQGVYSMYSPIVGICKVISQFDKRILEDNRKLEILKRSLITQNIINNEQVLLTEYLMSIIDVPIDEIGQIHLEIGTISDNFMASIILQMMEKYHFLPDIARKMKNKKSLIDEIIKEEHLDVSVTLSVCEIYDEFVNSKIEVNNRVVYISKVQEESYVDIRSQNNVLDNYHDEGMCDEENLFNKYLEKAEQGDDYAATEIGKIEIENNNYEEAVRWFRKAAENGYADAQNRLGVRYSNGEGVEKDKEESFKWFLRAAQQGHMKAQNNVGDCYYYGNGVYKNEEEAFKWYLKAAKQGHIEAQNTVGVCYYYGDGVKNDKEKAFEWYLKAAENGYDKAQYSVGFSYYYGYGTKEDKKEAFEWFLKAAENGYDEAQCGVGFSYYYGYGVPVDYKESIKWLRKSAEQGCDNAIDSLNDWYCGGDDSIDRYFDSDKYPNFMVKKHVTYDHALMFIRMACKSFSDKYHTGEYNNDYVRQLFNIQDDEKNYLSVYEDTASNIFSVGFVITNNGIHYRGVVQSGFISFLDFIKDYGIHLDDLMDLCFYYSTEQIDDLKILLKNISIYSTDYLKHI